MKKKWAKSAFSLFLCLLTVALFPLGVFGETLAAGRVTPTIVVLGYENNALYADPSAPNPKKEFPPDLDFNTKFAQYLSTYVAGISQGEYPQTTLAIFPEVVGWLNGIRCNHNGTSLLDVGPLSRNGEPVSNYELNTDLVDAIAGDLGKMVAEEIGAKNTYIFSYDWRLDPLVHAKELNELVAQVKQDTGASKVSILSEGMGGIVASTYMTKYASANGYADIKNYVTVNSAAMGSTLFGDLYTGEIDLDPNGIVRYTNDLPKNIPVAAIMWLLNHILRDEGTQYEFAMKVDAYIIAEKNNIYNTYIRDIINKIPGLWAMVPYDTYDQALTFMYPEQGNNYDTINDSLLLALNEYHSVQKKAPDTLYDAQRAGVQVAVVSSYGMQPLPVTNYATVESGDGVVDARYSSFGATTAFLNNEWVGRGNGKQIYQDGHDHRNKAQNIAFGYSVDASTCVLPENTWMIYGMKRGAWDYASDGQYYFIIWLITADKQRTVWDSYYYPQFLNYYRFSVPGTLYNKTRAEEGRFTKKGDVDMDGAITAADSRLALMHSAKLITLTRKRFANADLNGDNVITAAEARTILRVAAKLEKFS
ncbi:MAG: dockerin type I repeat-containing protein [Oscillospiraceae bacterium]|jgi:hypothetical protein|nr:dockerin type I repeat-containing protein [Oscillospiraceae bacterium]